MRLIFRYIIMPLALLTMLMPAVAQSDKGGAAEGAVKAVKAVKTSEGAKTDAAKAAEATAQSIKEQVGGSNLKSEDRVMPENAPRVRGSIEPDSIGIGDRFLYTIEVEKDQVQGVFFPEFGGEGTSHYELIESMPVDTLEREGRRMKLRKQYLLAAFQEGIHGVIPQVMYMDKNIVDTLGGPDTLKLMVTTFQIDSTSHSIFDLKGQMDMPFKFGEITGYLLWGIVGLILLALLIYAIHRILKHYGKSFGTIFKPAPPLPPHVVAFMALEKLREERLYQEGEHKSYYSRLTDILREYISGEFGVGAMEMTSDEIIESMRGVEIPQKQKMDLADILRDADLVKFAKAEPEAEQCEQDYRSSWEFIEQTKPQEPSEEDEDDAAQGDKQRKGEVKESK